jgi:hypothetical protein
MGQFLCVRIMQMNQVDIAVFDFDFDLTWWAVFVNANEQVYSRYGGRDARDPEGRMSVAGLKNTMRQVLLMHQQQKDVAPPAHTPKRPAELFGKGGGKGCIHCHHVWEGLHKLDRQKAGKSFNVDSLFVYPLPENIGLVLDIDQGNKINKVTDGSAAQKAGLRPGDFIAAVEQVKTYSQGDVMYALNKLPWEGKATLQFVRDGRSLLATVDLAGGWRKTNLSWRKSLEKEKTKPDFKAQVEADAGAVGRPQIEGGPPPSEASEPGPEGAPSDSPFAKKGWLVPAVGFAVGAPVLAGGVWLGVRRTRKK